MISPGEKDWAELLSDMLDIHGLIFNCIGVETCFEICVSARLASGIKLTIQNCATLIETKKNEKSLVKVSYEKAIDLILEATEEYFNGSKTFTDPNMELAKSVLRLCNYTYSFKKLIVLYNMYKSFFFFQILS